MSGSNRLGRAATMEQEFARASRVISTPAPAPSRAILASLPPSARTILASLPASARAILALLAAAFLASLITAPLAAAASPSPVSSGRTTLAVTEGFAAKLQKADVRLALVKPSSFRGNTVSFPVSGGEVRTADGKGRLTHRGGLRFRSGKHSVTLKSLTIDTASRSLTARTGGRQIRFAHFAGYSSTRVGFEEQIDAKRLQLTAAGASVLRKVAPVFRPGVVLGSTMSEIEPTVLEVAAGGAISFDADATLLGKLADVGVEIQTLSPTSAAGAVFASPISGGTISPYGDTGSVASSGGIRMVQGLPGGPTSTLTLGAFGVELGGTSASAEVTGESNGEAEGRMPLNLGSPGRTSIADLTLGSVTPNPTTRSVAVGATATVQPLAAEVLEGFVRVFQAYYAKGAAATLQTEIKEGKKPAMSEAEVKAASAKSAEARVANDQIRAGEALGSFSFVASTE